MKHLVNMCAELKVRTLAEMVETAEAEDAVRKAGVDYAQGWLYGRASEKPMDQAQITAFLKGGSGVAVWRSARPRISARSGAEPRHKYLNAPSRRLYRAKIRA